jgi:hypothetical protein
MRRLGGSVNDQHNVGRILLKNVFYGSTIADVRIEMPVLLTISLLQESPVPRSRRGAAKEQRAHIIINSTDLKSTLRKKMHRFGPNQPCRAGDYNC